LRCYKRANKFTNNIEKHEDIYYHGNVSECVKFPLVIPDDGISSWSPALQHHRDTYMYKDQHLPHHNLYDTYSNYMYYMYTRC